MNSFNDVNNQGAENLDPLVAKAKLGDEDARESLFRALKGYLDVVTRQQFNQSLQAKLGHSDVAQQTMLHAAEKFESFRGNTTGELKAWLKQILLNEVRRSERVFFSEKRNVRREARNPQSESKVQIVTNLADSLPTPGTQMALDEQSSQVIQSLQKLPDDYRQVIELRMWKNLPFKQIGEMMNRSESAVTKLWIRALAMLQEEIEQQR